MSRILCHCLSVTEAEVKAALRAGADTVDAVGDHCEAGTGCGSCRGGIEILLSEHQRRQGARRLPKALLDQLGLFSRNR